jgi:sulfatase modifying factor 1
MGIGGPKPSKPTVSTTLQCMPLHTKRNLSLTALVATAALAAGMITSRMADAPAGAPVDGPAGMAWVPGGKFLMGSDHKLAQDNERPAHPVRVDGFWMDRHHVTNAEFRKFVEATGYVTTAEKKPEWETMKVQVPPGTPKPPDSVLVAGAMVFVGTDRPVQLGDWSQWWRYVPGADWKHPQGRAINFKKSARPTRSPRHDREGISYPWAYCHLCLAASRHNVQD